MSVFDFVSKIKDSAQQRVYSYGAQFTASAIFFIVFYIANPLKWQFSGHYNVTTLVVLRVFAVLLCLGLSVWRFWPKRLLPYLPLFWLFVLFYNLPFRTTFTILHSAYSHSYAAYGVLGFVVLAMLVDNFLYICLAISGIICAIIVYFSFGGYHLPLAPISTFAQAAYMVVTISFIKLVFFNNHNLRLEARISAFKTLAGAIAHELRSPIVTISMACQNDAGTAQRISQKVLSTIDLILNQIKFMEASSMIECDKINVKQCLIDVYNDPIFSDKDRDSISIDVGDKYDIKANRKLIAQVFINLLRNSLRAIKDADAGRITILSTIHDTGLTLSFHDNGSGIDHKLKKHLFKPFYGQSQNGIGIGLAFSKLALESMGHKIACESQKNSFTRFTITFDNHAPTKDVT